MTLKAHDKIEKLQRPRYVYVLHGTMYLDREWKADYKASFLTQHIKGDKASHDVPKYVVVVVVTLYTFIFFSRFTGQISTKRATKHTCRKGDLLYLLKWRTPPFYKGR